MKRGGLLTRSGKKRNGGGKGGPFISAHGGVGQVGGRQNAAASCGGGAWQCTQAMLSAGSGPTEAGAGGRCLRMWSVPNRGEVGGCQVGPRYSPGRRGQIRLNCFKNIQNFPNFDQSKFELPKLQKFGKKYYVLPGLSL
jgi:hypothetical protein